MTKACLFDKLDEAMLKFAQSYADQAERDFTAFVKLIRSGKLRASKEAR